MRIEKVAILDEVIARVKDSDYCFIINHGGVTVAQFAKPVRISASATAVSSW